MELLYGLTGLTVITILFAMIAGLAKPSLFAKLLRQHATRKRILTLGLVSLFTLGGVATALEPEKADDSATQGMQSAQQVKAQDQAKVKAAETKRETRTVTEKMAVPFTDQIVEDPTLSVGFTKVIQEGRDGEKTYVYDIEYVNGVQQTRTLKSESITAAPLNRVIAKGTYTAPPQSSCPNGTYINTAGNTVCRPATSTSAPAGATARCVDGTYSYSQSRRGTCSHHGGVASWL